MEDKKPRTANFAECQPSFQVVLGLFSKSSSEREVARAGINSGRKACLRTERWKLENKWYRNRKKSMAEVPLQTEKTGNQTEANQHGPPQILPNIAVQRENKK